MRAILLGAVLLGACGGDGSGTPAIDAPMLVDADIRGDSFDGPTTGTFTLTSATITEGQPIPAVHTCNGANTSPALSWTDAPAGTLSFAVVLTDVSFNNFVHSAIYDIPASEIGLPADVEKVYAPTDVPGAHQTPAYQSSVRGYLGPCPPNQHTYEFKVYAMNAATVPGATMATTKDQLVTILAANNAGTATLTGTYAQP